MQAEDLQGATIVGDVEMTAGKPVLEIPLSLPDRSEVVLHVGAIGLELNRVDQKVWLVHPSGAREEVEW